MAMYNSQRYRADLKSMDTALHRLAYVSPERELLYITDATGTSPSYKMEELSCFFPGLLALGVDQLSSNTVNSTDKGVPSRIEIPESIKERHFWAAHGIAETCWILHADNPTGLGSEVVDFDKPADEARSRWYDVVDAWDADGRPGFNPPGIRGADRQPVRE